MNLKDFGIEGFNLESLQDFKEVMHEIIVPDDIKQKIDQAAPALNSAGFDPWGLDPETLKLAGSVAFWAYKNYFRVETSGLENLPEGRLMVISNHGCQIPLDALFITSAMIMEAQPPRICRAMVDHWVPRLPFIGDLFSRCGEVVGAPHNCTDMLEEENCVLIFPEGTRGAGKTIFERYQMQKFGTGFMRIALETKTPILPVAVIGSEEIFPSLHNFKPLAKLLRFPYFPITPFFPHLGLLGAIPLPSKITLRFGKPLYFDQSADSSEETVAELANTVKDAIQKELNTGIKIRGDQIFTKSALDPKANKQRKNPDDRS